MHAFLLIRGALARIFTIVLFSLAAVLVMTEVECSKCGRPDRDEIFSRAIRAVRHFQKTFEAVPNKIRVIARIVARLASVKS